MKLNYQRTIFIGFAFLSICAFWQMYDNIIPLILQNTFGLNETAIGGIMAADNVLAVLMLPFLGSLSDKIDTKWGKRTPFIVVGTLLAVSFLMIIPYADNTRNLVLFVVMLGCVLIAMGLYRSPAVALMPDLTPKHLRSKANAIINLMGAIGGVYALVLISVLVGQEANPNYYPLFIGIAIIMILALILLVLSINEKKLASKIMDEYQMEPIATSQLNNSTNTLPKEVNRSLYLILISIFLWFMAYNAVTTAFSRYVQKVWGLVGGGFANCLMIATVAAILSYIPIGILAEKYGRKKSIMVGLVLMLMAFFSVVLINAYTPLINISFVLIGIGWATVSVNSLPMVVEICKDGDVGKYTGLYYTFSMSAQIITPILSGFLFQNISYKILFPYACFFTIIAMITMSMVKHGDSIAINKKSVLEHFDVED